jgi:hypothetical protein
MTAVAPSALADIRLALRGQNLIKLEWVCRQLPRADVEDIDAAPLAELRAALRAAGDTAGPVLVDPRLGGWLGRLVRLIERQAPRIMRDGMFRACCAEAGVFAAAARLLAWRDADGLTAGPPTRIRIGATGRTPLPGTGIVVAAPRELAGLTALVRLGRGEPQISVLDIAGRPSPALLATEAVPAPGLVIPDGDPVDRASCLADPLLSVGPPVVTVQRGPIDLLSGAVPGIAIVPPDAGTAVRTAHALAAAAHLAATLSPAAAAWPPLAAHPAPPPWLAEVCEAGQLHRLLALRAVLQDLRAPGVAAVDEIVVAVGEWVASVGDQDPGGGVLLDTLRAAGLVPGCPAAGPRAAAGPLDAAEPAGRDGSGRLAWRAAWRRAGGQWRVPRPAARQLTAGPGELAPVLAELGCPHGIEVNLLGDQRLRADPTMDHLSLLLVREPDRYAALAASLDAAADCEVRQVLLGHCAYIEQRFADALGSYARLLCGHPGDADLWRDLTFALRHLGLPEPGQAWLFRPQEVVARASACCPDVAVLDALLPHPAGRPGWPDTARFATGLLEWVGHDPDHG